jgi:NTP pyrophosphatase (non-canonical NTP hydrolase)
MAIDLTPSAASTIETTYKSRELEGWIDIHFYRKIGFRLANFFGKLKMTPAAVSFFGCLLGVVAGHLYYYRDLSANIAGMVLHVGANTLDNADGQLARLTNRKSRMGRIIDSLADHLIWVSIYVHLALRYLAEGATPAVAFLALGAGLSHALQGAAADYYRNSYLYFVKGRPRADLDSSSIVREEYRRLSWWCEPWHKFLLALYLNFTRQQEMLSPGLKRLHQAIGRDFPSEIPIWLQTRYRDSAQPMLRWWRFLMTNTRMFLLFLLLLIGRPVWYFWLELSAFNFLLVYLILQQEKMSQSLLELVTARRGTA